ncbi:MAG: hypothetical protein LCI02_07160 [Proteobacteria bacterium]|nr:hypothetical protein [Pseudomonadota bacterium]
MPTAEPTARRAGRPARVQRRLGWAAATSLLVAAGCIAAGLWLALRYPLSPPLAPALFALACVAFGVWPGAWLVVLPAALPVIGFAPWTGWITFEEWDLLVLAIAAGGYLRRAIKGGRSRAGDAAGAPRASPLVLLALLLYAAATALSMLRGFDDAGGFAFGLFQGYREPMNAVRLAKPLFAPLLLWPLWRAAVRRNAAAASRQLSLGLVLGLLATSLAAIWERVAFTGLLNFSTDYRTTALFWEMHVGGAALDGMLALTFAFVVRELMTATSRPRWLLMAGVLPLAGYVCLTTFSRGVYLAIPMALTVMLMVYARQSLAQRSLQPRRWLLASALAAAWVAAFAWAAATLFPGSGYRGLLALLGCCVLLLAAPRALGGVALPLRLPGLAAGALLAAAAWGLSHVVDKGAYIAFAACALFTLGLIAGGQRSAARSRAAAVAVVGGLVAALVSAALVIRHWGGGPALTAALPVLIGLALALGIVVVSRRPPWPTQGRWLGVTGGALVLTAGVVAAFSGGDYMSGRFTTTGSDFGGRVQHWRQGLALLQTPAQWLFGRGLGRFVDDFAFAVPSRETPGDYRLRDDGGNAHLTLVAGRHELGWGEVQRLSQRVPVPVGPAVVSADLRSDGEAVVHFEVCLKHLLYDQGCLIGQARLPARPGQWQAVKLRLDGAPLDAGSAWAPRLAMFSVASETAGQRIDVDNLQLTASDGRNLLVNGGFSDDLARWFMTSDRHHMPWHIKNMAAHVLFDQGLVGLVLLATLVAAALWRVVAGAAHSHALAPSVAGGLAGFLVVGMFDSLLDIPRVAFLFYFLVLLGLTLQPPRPAAAAANAA